MSNRSKTIPQHFRLNSAVETLRVDPGLSFLFCFITKIYKESLKNRLLILHYHMSSKNIIFPEILLDLMTFSIHFSIGQCTSLI